jgi:hypothetical protein
MSDEPRRDLQNNCYTATLTLKSKENAKNNCYINCYA